MVALIDNLRMITGTDITEEDIERMVAADLGYEYTRQSGKTTTVVHTVEEIMVFVSRLFNFPIHTGIFAPQREQAKTDFDRLKINLSRTRQDLTVIDHDADKSAKEESNARTLVLSNGSSCYIFPVTKSSKPESKTLHIIILEESQDLDDTIVNEQILPIGTSTNAVVVRIGTAGIRICDFYKKIQKGEVYVMTWREIAADRRRLYELTGDPKHLIYERFVRSQIEKYGEKSDLVARPYNNVWLMSAGMFISKTELSKCRIIRPYDNPMGDPGFAEYREWYRSARRSVPEIDSYATQRGISAERINLYRIWLEAPHFAGLDTAKETDQTVLKIGREVDGRIVVVFSLEMNGLNYEDQFDLIVANMAWFNVVAIGIDSTGQGDFMPDKFERHTGYTIHRVKFSLMTKDAMYKSYYNKIVNAQFGYYYQDKDNQEHHRKTAESIEDFENETSTLVKEYKGEYMSIHHPDGKNEHDDHPDSTALMIHAYDQYNGTAGLLDYYKENLPEQ